MSSSAFGGVMPIVAASSCRGRNRKARGIKEGEKFEQVEPRQLGIAQPVAGQRRVEQQVRRRRNRRNRLTAPDALHAPLCIGDPDADMAGMDRGQGEQGGGHG